MEYSPRNVPGFAKYAVDANLFRLVLNPNPSEASYKPEQRRGGTFLGEYTGVERSGGEYT